MSRSRWVSVAAAAALAAAVAGCARDDGEVHVPADELAAQIVASVSADLGVTPQVTCPEDLPGVVGATTTCELVIGDSAADALVTVTEVTSDDEVRFDVEVDGVTEVPAEEPGTEPTEEGAQGDEPGEAPGDAPEQPAGEGEPPADQPGDSPAPDDPAPSQVPGTPVAPLPAPTLLPDPLVPRPSPADQPA